ncbi:helix-turn-helix domain-containing protein [Paenibacillus sp. JSM ZJ436]|uniref:helix-turn-helix domain-containing protein n=1 Tax=Paenibacillus sp. JSM ZJ436 TaxID=3376190 RepID=UPI00379EDDAD
MSKPWEIMKQLNQMNFNVLIAGLAKHGPCWHSKAYKHRFHSIWMVTRGSGTFMLDGNSYTAEPGRLFVVSPGMVVERMSEPAIEFYFVRFEYALACASNDPGNSDHSPPSPFPLSGAYTILTPLSLVNTMEQLVQNMKRRGEFTLMHRRILFLELLMQILTDLRTQLVTGDTTMAIEKTINYMVNHYNENITLEQLSTMASLSISHYSRLFKKYTNYSPIHYLTHLRMDRAKELLILSDYRLKAIARSVGYEDELYFSRLFKKTEGLSPSTYAKNYETTPKH